jgi:hypothetical protein
MIYAKVGKEHGFHLDRSLVIIRIILINVKEVTNMPTISMFYGILIRMFFKDIDKHNLPHIHAEYQDEVAVYSIPDGKLLAGSIPIQKEKLVIAWIEIHKDDLLADWELAVNGKTPFRIKGLDQ